MYLFIGLHIDITTDLKKKKRFLENPPLTLNQVMH